MAASRRSAIRRRLAWAACLHGALVAFAANALPALAPGGVSEFQVELTPELRQIAGRGSLSPATYAVVAIAVPPKFEPTRDWPVMIVNATVDRPGQSRALLRAYAAAALDEGWILLAADPVPDVDRADDEATLRFALDFAALAVLQRQWPGAGKARLAFGGFSGGAKYSGWLAAAFAGQKRAVIGVYLASCNEDTLAPAARDFDVLDERFRRIPVFLQSGENDSVATPADHRRVQADLENAGFRRVRVEYFAGTHEVAPAPLRQALRWFSELAGAAPNAR
jgi:predicted esterase